MCFEAIFATFSLSLIKGAILLLNVFDSTNFVYSMPAAESMLIPSATVQTRRCPNVSCPLWAGGLAQSPLFSVNFLVCV